MKNIFFLFAALVFVGCSSDKDSEIINAPATADRVAAVMSTPVDASLDEVNQGLYKGLLASYDLTTKGTIQINTSEKGTLEAGLELIKVNEGLSRKVYFEGTQDLTTPDRYTFTSDRGSFTITLNDEKKFQVDHFTFDGVDAYLIAYKLTRGVDVSLAMGTFQDDTDPSFNGNWDIINRGGVYISPAGEHSTFATTLLIFDEIVISQGANMYINQDGPQNNDPFTETCFYNETLPHGWFYDTTGYRELIAYNQTTTFATRVATWSLAYYFFGGEFIYDTPACNTPAASGYGSFAWDGKAGRIFVDTLTDL